MDIIQNYEIEDISKKYTRKEFLKKCTEPTFTEYDIICPEDLGLKNYCRDKCIDCWKKAVENLKFKGEDDMNKYTIGEALNILTTQPNKVFIEGNEKVIKAKLFLDDNGFIRVEHNVYDNEICGKYKPNDKVWEIYKEPMYFMEAINFNKKIRFEYNGYGSSYKNIQDILLELSDEYSENEIINILNKKCWYVEE